jgi:hypothetical protein
MAVKAAIYDEPQAAPTTFYEELLHQISWKSDKLFWRWYWVTGMLSRSDLISTQAFHFLLPKGYFTIPQNHYNGGKIYLD